MNEEILKISSLAAYGNAFLVGGKSDINQDKKPAFFEANYKFSLKLPVKNLKKIDIIAESPQNWFHYLKKSKVTHLMLHYQYISTSKKKDTISTKPAGHGNQWHIIAMKDEGIDIWAPIKITDDDKAKELFYLMEKDSDYYPGKIIPLETTKLYLKEILTDLVNFTSNNNLDNWISVFQQAIDHLSAFNFEEHNLETIIPIDDYSMDAKQILAASKQAWIFGGKGAWNEIRPIDNYDLYSRLSANLYDTLCKSIVSAINSYH
ncbi:MAG: hypothetical protein FK734_03310 [Asgard group archaeon]|nr:hypothetical protein [Asgard group archaeon]